MSADLIKGRIEKNKGFFGCKILHSKQDLIEDKNKSLLFKIGDLVTSKILDKAYFSKKEKKVGKIIKIEKNYINNYTGHKEPYRVEWGDGTVFSYAEYELLSYKKDEK